MRKLKTEVDVFERVPEDIFVCQAEAHRHERERTRRLDERGNAGSVIESSDVLIDVGQEIAGPGLIKVNDPCTGIIGDRVMADEGASLSRKALRQEPQIDADQSLRDHLPARNRFR